MMIALCGLAGIMSLLCMSAVVLTLLPAIGLGATGLAAAAGFGLVSLGAGLGAALLALGQARRA